MTAGTVVLFLCVEATMHIIMEIIIDNDKILRGMCRSSTINEASQQMRRQIREAVDQGWLQISGHPSKGG